MRRAIPTIVLCIAVAAVAIVGSAAGGPERTASPQAVAKAKPKPHKPVTLSLGITFPYSGASSYYGPVQQSGIEVAIKALNASNGGKGLDGFIKFKTIVDDDQGSSSIAAQQEQQLTSVNHVVATFTTFSGPPLAQGPIADQTKTPLIAIGGGTPLFAGAFQYLWAMQLNELPSMDALGKYIVAHTKVRKVALYLDNSALGRGISAHVKKAWPKLGIDVVGEIVPDLTQTDHQANIIKLKSMGAQGVLVSMSGGAPDGNFLVQAKQLGLNMSIFCELSCSSASTLAVAGTSADGILYVNELADWASKLPAMQTFVKGYRALYHKAPDDPYEVDGYDSMQLLAKAVDWAVKHNKPLNGASVEQGIEKVECWDGAEGRLCWRTDHLLDKAVAIQTVLGGDIQTLQVIPAPAHKKR